MPQSILIADDEAHVRHILSLKLRTAGYEIRTARNGGEALEEVMACQPSLLLTDLQMPELNGLELCLKLAEQEATAKLPVIMITSRGDVLDLAVLNRTNIKHLLEKPFSPTQVLSLVNKALATAA